MASGDRMHFRQPVRRSQDGCQIAGRQMQKAMLQIRFKRRE